MDEHVLPASPAHKKRQSYDDSVVAAVTLDARHLGHVAAAKWHGIPQEMVRTWLAYWHSRANHDIQCEW